MRRRALFVIAGAMALGVFFMSPASGVVNVRADSVSAVPPPDVRAFGDALFLGATNSVTFNQPIVGIARTRTSGGYWETATDGGVFGFGDARFFGSMGGTHLNQPVVGIAATPTSSGYWLAARDGGVFGFGDARFFGSMGGRYLNQPIVGVAATPSGRGYWLVAADGGVFSFGDARFFGSMGGRHLNQPIVGVAATPSGRGYWLVAADGGVFSFGDAHFYGPIPHYGFFGETMVGIAARPQGDGYWLVGSGGMVFQFGNAPFLGDARAADISKPVAGIASTGSGQGFWVAGRGTPGVLPGQVTVIYAGHSGGSGEIGLDWTAVPGATGYRVERADAAGGPFSIAADVNMTTGIATVARGVTNVYSDRQNFYPPSFGTHPAVFPFQHFRYVEYPFLRHYFRVTAYNGSGDGPVSVVVCGTPVGYPTC